MRMPATVNKRKIVVFGCIVLVLGVIVFLASESQKKPTALDNDPLAGLSFKADDVEKIGTYAYTETFAEGGYEFSFKYPAGFQIMTLSETFGEVVIVQSIETELGVQIFSGPLDDVSTKITRRFLNETLPESVVRNVKEVSVDDGTAKVEGLLFDTDNPNFENGSSELWFVRKGRLYQLTTYRALRPLLEGIFATWQFR